MKRRFFKHPIPILIVAGLVVLGFAIGKPGESETKRHTVQTLPPEVASRTDNLNDRFWLYLPKRYEQASKEKPMPLIIYLHGSSRRGRDIEQVKANGLAPLMDERDDFEFVVASPQALAKHAWQRCWQPDDVIVLLDHLLATYHIDPKRVYLTGLSMGGYGTWAAIGKHAERFAAAAPICGGGDPASAKDIGKLPVWAFHGGDDRVVPVERSREMVHAIQATKGKGKAKLTVYPGVGHDSYTRTYANSKLYEWFLEHE
jgi:predicted peptidase